MSPHSSQLSTALTGLRRSLGLPRPPGVRHLPHRATIPMPGSCATTDDFKEAMRLLPSPVSVVTAMDEQGLPRGLTCSAVCSLSMAPPAMLVCVNRKNRSLDAIRHSRGFVVNLLRAGRMEMSEVFASARPAKFVNTGWRPSPVSGLPLLARDALTFVDCQLQAEIEVGSHAILVGLVRGSGTGTPDGGPLVYWRRSYGGWAAHGIPEGRPHDQG